MLSKFLHKALRSAQPLTRPVAPRHPFGSSEKTFEVVNTPCPEIKSVASQELQSFIHAFAPNKQIHQRMVREFQEYAKIREGIDKIRREKEVLAEINDQNETKLAEIQSLIETQETEAMDIIKRLEGEMAKAKTFAVTNLARDSLEIVDNLERAIRSLTANFKGVPQKDGFLKDMEAVRDGLLKSMETYGIKPMECKAGDPVDPNFHHIISFIPVPGKNNDEILDVTQVGYLIENRVLRAAKVVVVKN